MRIPDGRTIGQRIPRRIIIHRIIVHWVIYRTIPRAAGLDELGGTLVGVGRSEGLGDGNINEEDGEVRALGSVAGDAITEVLLVYLFCLGLGHLLDKNGWFVLDVNALTFAYVR